MRFGNYLDNPFLTNKLDKSKDGLHYTISDKVDENGCYVVDFDGSEEEFFDRLGYRLASDVEKDFLNVQDEHNI